MPVATRLVPRHRRFPLLHTHAFPSLPWELLRAPVSLQHVQKHSGFSPRSACMKFLFLLWHAAQASCARIAQVCPPAGPEARWETRLAGPAGPRPALWPRRGGGGGRGAALPACSSFCGPHLRGSRPPLVLSGKLAAAAQVFLRPRHVCRTWQRRHRATGEGRALGRCRPSHCSRREGACDRGTMKTAKKRQ